ncbi:MAG: aconitase family protein [Acidaminococcus sp.]|jgi:3-isopropylmalate/(R)-2-methylmalate dehydratase large subunit|nr:aconitase family protein [Acidaminococcus sp.]MCI2099620.1 aconitase family protein [Acidaminococcus sp.]MCI2113705.1 aconitase family protein [Acidaminococcus sp.]MCI2115788.1 aconitase family protein [Acidaminococcus sp.]
MSRIEEILGALEGTAVCVKPTLVLVTNGFGHEVTGLVSSVKARDRAIVVYDHNVPAGLPEESKVFEEILHFAKKNGLTFYQAKGIAQKWLLEEKKITAGDIVITGTRHSSILGSVGAMGLGLSHTELARVLESDEYQMIVPQTLSVAVTGKLPQGVGVIDAALNFLSRNRNLVGKAVEFIAPQLSTHEKEVLCEMAVDTGAVTAFAVSGGAPGQMLDLSKVTRMVRKPCTSLYTQMEAEFGTLEELKGQPIQAGQIAGMNGGDIDSLRLAASLMQGKKLKRGFRLSISPATSQTYLQALEEGLITTFIDFNAQIQATGDHDIVSQGAGVIGHHETLLTTGLYTYQGAMGCDDASIYTASVESIMAAACE